MQKQKPELQRIESTLNQLTVSGGDAIDRPKANAQGCSFKIWSTAVQPTLPVAQSSAISGMPQAIGVGQSPVISGMPQAIDHRQPVTSASSTQASPQAVVQQAVVQPFPAQTFCPQMPTLPKFKPSSFSSHRHEENPGLALKLLKEVEAKAAGWQNELQQILQQVQDIYLEGPIVDGWLESQSSEPAAEPKPGESSTLRHAEVDRLLDYVQEICQTRSASPDATRTGYRLCGLDADGKLWSRPCPPEQLPHVSLAIARYQKLRQLLGRKQYLASRLSHLAGMLVELDHHLQEAP